MSGEHPADRKFAFISCVNQNAMYEESLRYARALRVPEGYETEFIAVRGASSMTGGYNEAMLRTNARYKIYLHQDVFLVNRDLLFELLSLFQANPRIGLSRRRRFPIDSSKRNLVGIRR